MRIFLFICLILLILLLILLGLYLLAGCLLYHHYFNKKGKFVKKCSKFYLDNDKEIFDNFHNIECESFDKLKLSGKFLDNQSNKLAILLHGHGGNYFDTFFAAKIFLERGYDILTIDQRGCGKSEGKELTFGIKESDDLILWIEKMLNVKPQYKIVLYGQSTGGNSIILACEKFPLNVVSVIVDSCYDNLEKEVKFLLSKNKVFGKVFYKILTNFTKKTVEFDLKQGDCIKKIKHLKVPILFFHGKNDEIVPLEMTYNLSSQVSEIKRDVFVCEDCQHLQTCNVAPEKYRDKIKKFLTHYNM